MSKNNEKKGLKRFLLSTFGASLALIALTLGFSVQVAQAATGVGNGISGGSYTTGSYWVAGWGPVGTAWNAINNDVNTHYTLNTAEALIRGNVTPPPGYSMDQFVQLCKESTVIWWIRDAQSNYKFWGRSYQTSMSSNTILSGSNGMTGYDRERADAYNALEAYGSDYNRRNITIVCSAVYTPPVTYKARTWTATQGVSNSYSGVLTYTYSEAEEIDPNGTLTNQSRTVNTAFKTAYDNSNSGNLQGNYSSTASALNSGANAADQTATNNFLPTGDPNRVGLESGGVLNLTTTSDTGSITIGYTQNRSLTQYATCDSAGNNCNWAADPSAPAGFTRSGTPGAITVGSLGSDTGWNDTGNNNYYVNKSSTGTGNPVDFYQILSVTCNVSWFNDLMSSHPGNESQSTGVSGYSLPNNNVINTAYRNLTQRPSVSGDNTVILGNRGNATSVNNANAVERSGYDAFYSRPCSDGRWANEQVTVSGTAEWNQPYSYASDIVRQITIGGIDPIGANNLRDQAGVAGNGLSTTNYAAVRDQLAAGTNTSTNIYAAVDAAIQADINFPTPSIQLNTNNRNGMAEGGVLNVYERTRWATLSSYQSNLYYRAMAQTRIYDWSGSAWVAGTWTNNVQDNGNNNLNSAQNTEVNRYPNSLSSSGIAAPGPNGSYPCGNSVSAAPGSCVASNVTHAPIVVTIPADSNESTINGIYAAAAPLPAEGWYLKGTTYSNDENLDTPETTGFWQMMSVHCNPNELQAALDAYGTLNVDYFIVSQVQTDTGVTAVIHTRATPAQPTANGSRLFGFNSAPVNNPALLRTGQLGFYDKECSLQCTTDPASASGASAVNGAVNNVSNSGNLVHVDSFGGAQSGDTISNYFEMFRDNESREITTNIAYPNTSGTVFTYDGHAPISTTVTLWHDASLSATDRITVPEGNDGYPSSGGTPDTSAPGGQLTVRASGGTGTGASSSAVELFTGSQAPTTQTNFSLVNAAHPVNSYSGPYATQLAGAYNIFDVSSTWASLKDRPVVMNVKWEYQPTTQTRVPRTVGFQVNGTQRVDATSTINQRIDVRCYAVYGTTSSNMGADYDAITQTGTGVANTVDLNVLNVDDFNGSGDTLAHRTDTNLVIKFVRGVAE